MPFGGLYENSFNALQGTPGRNVKTSTTALSMLLAERDAWQASPPTLHTHGFELQTTGGRSGHGDGDGDGDGDGGGAGGGESGSDGAAAATGADGPLAVGDVVMLALAHMTPPDGEVCVWPVAVSVEDDIGTAVTGGKVREEEEDQGASEGAMAEDAASSTGWYTGQVLDIPQVGWWVICWSLRGRVVWCRTGACSLTRFCLPMSRRQVVSSLVPPCGSDCSTWHKL